MTNQHREIASRVSKMFTITRRVYNLSQVELSQRLNLSQPFVSKLENALSVPGLVDWVNFCRIFEIDMRAATQQEIFTETMRKLESKQARLSTSKNR